MGLLDDAIREHLELKRRHGAEPGEIARLEHEAFGPVRRGEVAEAPPPREEAPPREEVEYDVPADDHEPAPAHAGEAAIDEDDWEFDEPEPAAEPAHEPAAPAADYEPPAPEPVEPPRSQETVAFSLDELDAEDEIRPAAEPEAPIAPPASPAPPAPPAGDRDEPDDVAPDEEPGEDDVLEETPDFLQETPEHDRLWFEQKPPRDFDF